LRVRRALHARGLATGMSAKHSNLGELIMRTWSKSGAVVAVLFGLMWVVVSAAVWADVKDYEFQLVQSEMKKGELGSRASITTIRAGEAMLTKNTSRDWS